MTRVLIITLGEGGTSLIPLKSLGRKIKTPLLYGKDETRNPTQSFKDRAISVGVSVLSEIGASDIGCVSGGGNTATSVAAYCARAKIRAHLYVPSSVPKVKLLHALVFGAEVKIIEGDNSLNAFNFGISAMKAKKYLPLMTRPQFNPYTLEGCKTIAFEIAEQMNWDVPDWVFIAVGTGTNLSGIWKGFRELYDGGILHRLPKLAAVQANTCMPLIDAFQRGYVQKRCLPGLMRTQLLLA